MYLSRISLDEASVPTPELLAAVRTEYGLHQAIWSLFADRIDRRRDFLYHVETRQGPPAVLALSVRRPAPSGTIWRVATKEYSPSLRSGSRLAFLLRANPVRTRDGKRHDVVMEEKRRLHRDGTPPDCRPTESELVQEAGSAWLQRRAEGLGFRLIAVRADGYRQLELGRTGPKQIRLCTIDYSGTLEVTDPDLFLRRALYEGVGPAKGFGCGLMLLRRA